MKAASLAATRRVIAYLFAAAIAVFAARYVGLNWSAFAAALAAITAWQLMLALVFFAIHIAFNAHAFALLNRGLDDSASIRVLRAAWLASLPAKYLPSGLGHVLGRGALLARFNVPARITLEAAIWEQGFSFAYCVLIAAGLFASSDAGQGWQWALMAAAAVALATAPAAVRRVSITRAGSTRALYRASTLYGISMLPYAAGYAALAYTSQWLPFLASLFAGTVAGVLAFPIPGGLGVRESTVLLLTESAGAPSILGAMFAGRALILIAETGASLLGLAAIRRSVR